MGAAPTRPRKRAFHRLVGFEVSGRISEAIVEYHHDVGAETLLDFNRCLRTEEMTAPIQVRLELDAVFADVPQRAEAEYLISAAIRQYRPVPSHESMQAAEPRDRFITRTQEQVIGIAEKNLNVELAELFGHHRLHRRLRADGHEHRRLDRAVRGVQTSLARAR